jgi:hypothetical protein
MLCQETAHHTQILTRSNGSLYAWGYHNSITTVLAESFEGNHASSKKKSAVQHLNIVMNEVCDPTTIMEPSGMVSSP